MGTHWASKLALAAGGLSSSLSFPGATIQSSTFWLETFIVSVLGVGCLESRCCQSRALRIWGRIYLFHAFLIASGIANNTWPSSSLIHHSNLCLHLHTCPQLCVFLGSFYSSEDISHSGLWAHHTPVMVSS